MTEEVKGKIGLSELFKVSLPDGEAAVGNVYCIGRNYVAHAKELGNDVPTEPVLFLKAASSCRPLASGPLAYASESLHHEAEIVLAIKGDVPLGAKPGWDAVAGVGLGLDMTRRDKQNELKTAGLPWTLAKSFAGATLVGPFLKKESFAHLDQIKFSLTVRGEVRQVGDSSLMIFSVPKILEFIASSHELHRGDLIYTGTPAGVGPMRQGDPFVLAFTELQDNTVRAHWNGTL